jgi:hypothetical protein
MCACLPLLRPVAQAVFGRVLTSGAGKSSSNNRRPGGLSDLNSDGLITIGGSGAPGGGKRPSFKPGARPFAVLDDTDSGEAILVGAKSASTSVSVSVQGSDGKAPSEAGGDIPLERIAVRQEVEVCWTEAKSHHHG